MNHELFAGKYRIKSTRLRGWDYSRPGAYFVTICTKNMECFFGEIVDGKLRENKLCEICRSCWHDLPNHYSNCTLDEFIIMPNHVHGIIFINGDPVETGGGDPVETGLKPVSTLGVNKNNKLHSLSEIIRGFKTFTARKINQFQNTQGLPFWQSRFYDRIIRTDEGLARARKYIIANPINWHRDRNNLR